MKTTVKTIIKFVLKIAWYLISRYEHDYNKPYPHPKDYDSNDYDSDLKDDGV